MDDRIANIEVKLAFQERTIADLDEVIRLMRDEIDALKRQIAELSEQVSTEASADGWEKPPHY